jgi:hypothetical protein
MKKPLIFLTLFTIGLQLNAQIPNSDFENWTNNGVYDMPDNYFTSNEVYYAIEQLFGITYPTSVYKKTPGHSGSFAIAAKNVQETTPMMGITDTVPGFAFLYSGSNAGIPFTQRPTALTGYYKFTQGAPGGSPTKDTARIYVMLVKSNGPGVDGDSIGGGELKIYQTASSYTTFTINISYIDGFSMPDTLHFGFFSSIQLEEDEFIDAYTIHPSTELVIDHIALTGVTGVNNPFISSGIQTYPNPAVSSFNIKNIPQGASKIEVADFTGAIVKQVNIFSDFETINTENLSGGLYYYRITNSIGEILHTDVFNIAK